MARYKISDKFMTILELQDVMGQQLRTLKAELSVEEREQAVADARITIGMANQMINAANLILNAEKVLAENKDLDASLLKDVVY